MIKINSISSPLKLNGAKLLLEEIFPKTKINLGEIDKFVYLSPPIINPATGNKIATIPSDLPPLKEGWVRLIHRTDSENAQKIIKSGLRGDTSISGTTKNASGEELWDNLRRDPNGKIYGTKKLVIDLPLAEYQKLFYGDYYKKGSVDTDNTYNKARYLFCKNKYIVGCLDNFGATKFLTEAQIQSMEKTSQLNPVPYIKPEDLRQLNPGRPKKYDGFFNKSPKQIKKQEQLRKQEAEIARKANQKAGISDDWE